MDYPSDATEEGAYCWVDGYDAGLAGKYDKDRADQCAILEDDKYNGAWKYACEDGGHTPIECVSLKNNPVDIENYYASLFEENRGGCYDDGYADGNSTSFNKDRDGGCSDYSNSYESGFNAG